MRLYEHVRALPAASIGNVLAKAICTTALALVTVIACATSACAQGSSAAISASELSASELAKGITNPVTELWSLQFQINNYRLETGNSNPESGKWVYSLYFQPVLPVGLTNDLNLITRPVITLYQSVPHPTRPSQSQ